MSLSIPEHLTFTNAMAVPEIDIIVGEDSIVEVVTAGPQGPPGLQNVYVQSNDPAVEFGWGPDEAGFIWIQT